VKVLLVDDDTDLLDVTAYALRREGFNVIVATDGIQAIRRWQHDKPDLVVLDVNMPHHNGFEVCRRIRQGDTTPVIMLTALHQEEQIAQGFQSGADDYVTKPFSPRQLAMRIRAIWRRSAPNGEPEPARELRVGSLILDAESHDVRYQDRPIQLTPIEFRLLYILAANNGRVVSTSRLVDYAWGYDGGDVSLLKTHVSHIRKKLDLPQEDVGEIRAIPRVGYRLTRNAEAS
jgi:DNA-binding response OmpR family regulator